MGRENHYPDQEGLSKSVRNVHARERQITVTQAAAIASAAQGEVNV
jgi:hypothetical protein